jgi:hypothetical protein
MPVSVTNFFSRVTKSSRFYSPRGGMPGAVQTESLVPATPQWQDMQAGGKPAFQAERLAVPLPRCARMHAKPT